MGIVTFGGGTHGGQLGLVQGDLSGPHSGKLSLSLLSVWSTVSWGPLGHSHWEFSLGLSFIPMKQRHWTCQAASRFEGHLRTDLVFGTGWRDTRSLLPLPCEEGEDVIPALVIPWSHPRATHRPSKRTCQEAWGRWKSGLSIVPKRRPCTSVAPSLRTESPLLCEIQARPRLFCTSRVLPGLPPPPGIPPAVHA